MDNNNIYLELELFLDPAITDTEMLKKELNNKIGNWNKMVVASPKYKSRVARARQFIKDGLPRLDEQANEARTEKLQQLRYAVQQQKYAGKIDESGFKKLKELFLCFSETTIQQESGFVGESIFKPPVIPPALKCDRAIPPIEMESIQMDLSEIENGKYADFYELLGITDPDKAETKDLYQKARNEEEKNRRIAVKTPEVDAKNRLLGKAAQYFKDDYERLNYDVALQRSIFNKLCQKSFQHRAIKGIITTEIYEQSINDTVLKGFKRQEAEYLVYEYYCIKMKCPPPISVDISRPNTISVSKNWKDIFGNLFSNSAQQQPKNQTAATPIDESKSITVDEEPTLLLESFHFDTIQNAVKPIDANNFSMIWNRVFFGTSALCFAPLGIVALDGKNKHFFTDLLVQCFWIACLLIFLVTFGSMIRRVFLRRSEDIRFPISAFFFTAILGVPILLSIYHYLPTDFLALARNEYWYWRLCGNLFQIGLLEEACKIVPVLVYLFWKRKKASMKMVFLIAILSSMGLFADKIFFFFSSFQNWLPQTPAQGLAPFQGELEKIMYVNNVNQIFTNILPIFSLMIASVFWTAIFSYYLSHTLIDTKQWWKFVLLGWGISSALHGFYLWSAPDYPFFAALIVVGSFVLFYGYLAKIRSQITNRVNSE